MKAIRCILMMVLLVSAVGLAEETAGDISKKSRDRGALNLVGLTAELKLVSTAADGKRREQVLTTTSKRIEGRSHVLARFSAPAGDSSSPYGKVRMLVDKETYVPMQVDYQDKSNQPFKRYKALKLKTYKGRVLAAESVMENLKTGSKTQLSVVKLEDATLADEELTERALERG